MADPWDRWLDSETPSSSTSDNASQPPVSRHAASSSSSSIAATVGDESRAEAEDEASLQDRWDAINSTLWSNWLQYVSNRAVDEPAFAALVTTYVALIVTGAVGNGLMCLVVARRPHMRTARHVFVTNLAVSDLLLCAFTMPFTLTEVLLKSWPLGEFMCKWVSALQATSIFVSTMSITAIALDRYNVIVYNPTTAQAWSRRLGAAAILTAVWTSAFLLALPLFVFRRLDSHYVGLPGLKSVEFCYEEWPMLHGRAAYSVASMLVQYVLPIAIVSVAHARICRQLHSRLSVSSHMRAPSRASVEQRRLTRTNTLLVSIGAIFCISWLPLNILNLVTDIHAVTFDSDRDFRVAFACCHVIGMSSACSNPLLYGWLNDNFRKEFKEIFAACHRACPFLPEVLPGTDTARGQRLINGSSPLPMAELGSSVRQQQRRRSSSAAPRGGLTTTTTTTNMEETTVGPQCAGNCVTTPSAI